MRTTGKVMKMKRLLFGIVVVIALVVGGASLSAPAFSQVPAPYPPPDGPRPGNAVRWYQHNQFQWIVPFGDPGPVVSFAIDTPGQVTGVLAAPHEAGGYSPESLAVGGLWVNGLPAVDKLWVTDGPMQPLVLTRLGDVPAGVLGVNRGDVVTITLSDGATGSPTWPETTWVLEVQE